MCMHKKFWIFPAVIFGIIFFASTFKFWVFAAIALFVFVVIKNRADNDGPKRKNDEDYFHDDDDIVIV